MKNVDIYLNFNGNCGEAFGFYKTVFGGEFIAAQKYGDVPGSEKMPVSDREKYIHLSLRLTPQTTLMGSDIIGSDRPEAVFGTNFHVCLQTDSEKEADKLFASLSTKGKIEMPMNKTFWGAYFGMCQDPFGVHWMISYHTN
jgi:PhnB protein